MSSAKKKVMDFLLSLEGVFWSNENISKMLEKISFLVCHSSEFGDLLLC